MNDIERLTFLIETLKKSGKVRNQSHFADLVSINGNTLTDIKAGRKPMSVEYAQRIAAAFPNINKTWILTGEGEMLKDERDNVLEVYPEQLNSASGTPVYDIDAVCGTDSRVYQGEKTVGYIDLPNVRKDSMVVTASGDSMEPVIKNGDKIVIRKINDMSFFVFGQIYLVIFGDYRLIKYVRKNKKNENSVILRSENPKYDDMIVSKSKIISLFIVENILSIKNLM